VSQTNAPDLNQSAKSIFAPLIEAKNASREKSESNAAYTDRVNTSTLTAYGECVVVIKGLMDGGMWSARKGKKGTVSASAQLKAALEAQATTDGFSKDKAKRLVEYSAAILEGDRAIDEVSDAADENAKAVVEALVQAEIETEAKLRKHVQNKGAPDPVLATLKKVSKLTDDQRADFLVKLAAQEKFAFADQGEAEVETEVEAPKGKGSRAAVNNGGAALAARREAKAAKAANGEPKAPRKSRKAAAEEAAAKVKDDPFADDRDPAA
jgi:hypothetical protein